MGIDSEVLEPRATGPSEHPGSHWGVKGAVSFWFFIRTTSISFTHCHRNANQVTKIPPKVPKDDPIIVVHESSTGNVTPKTSKDKAGILKDLSV